MDDAGEGIGVAFVLLRFNVHPRKRDDFLFTYASPLEGITVDDLLICRCCWCVGGGGAAVEGKGEVEFHAVVCGVGVDATELSWMTW